MIKTSAWLRDCTSLQDIPNDLKADYLDLSGCTALQAIPEGVEIGSLTLVNCPALVSLLDKLHLEGSLK